MARPASEAVDRLAAAGHPVADRQHHWVDRLPGKARDLAVLARWDRPIGTWLLLLPCWWGVSLGPEPPSLWLLALLAIGAIAMRGAGCTINDLIDRDLDRQVERTRHRPLAARRVSVREALAFVAAQCLIGLAVLVQLPPFAVAVGFAAVPLVVIYPFMKRVTWWPQAFLGITFNWGVLVGHAAVTGRIEAATLVLYLAGIAWTLGYDTLYAHQDREDDALIGVRSTARLFGTTTPAWVAGFYMVTLALIALAGWLALKAWPFWVMLPAVGLSLARQLRGLDLNDPTSCLAAFRANRLTGLLVTAALALGSLPVR